MVVVSSVGTTLYVFFSLLLFWCFNCNEPLVGGADRLLSVIVLVEPSLVNHFEGGGGNTTFYTKQTGVEW